MIARRTEAGQGRLKGTQARTGLGLIKRPKNHTGQITVECAVFLLVVGAESNTKLTLVNACIFLNWQISRDHRFIAKNNVVK